MHGVYDVLKLNLNIAEEIKDDLDSLIHLEIVSVGVGNKVVTITESTICKLNGIKFCKDKMQDVVFRKINQDTQMIVISLVCGVLVALILATIILALIKRHVKSREKLQGLTKPDTEASKDYQDLCRARMATKGQSSDGLQDKGESF